MELKYLIDAVNVYNKNADLKLIEKAYNFAKKAHEGQKREGIDMDYFMHPFETAMILTNIKADTPTICASLLHDTLEDTGVTIDQIKKEFGDDVASLVEGVTAIDKIYFKSREEYKAENLRKILLASNKDIRVLLIKLADRLHNLSTFKYVKDKRRAVENANETMDIFVPLAYKVGIGFIKDKLEDLSFSYIDPNRFEEIKSSINSIWKTSGKVVNENVDKIVSLMNQHKIDCKVLARYKSIYNIHKKLIKDNKKLENIYDILGIRIITKTIPECYIVLKIIETEFESEKDRFKDYIEHPASNNYQSLHTDVHIGNNIVEIQIRTEEMNNLAEYGGLHWLYKGAEKDKQFDKKISWLKQILEWQRKSMNAMEFVDHMKIDLFSKEIIVFTPKGDAIFLPEGSTPVDLAYAIHSHLGDSCSQAKVNGNIVPLDYALKSGEKVEIFTSHNAKPNRNWLKFVKSGKANYKIRAYLNLQRKPGEKAKKEDSKIMIDDLKDFLDIKNRKKAMKLSKCCNPQKGDEIVAFYKKDKTITVHKKSCINIYALNEKDRIEIMTKSPEKNKNKVFNMVMQDKPGIVSDILNIFSENRTPVIAINAHNEGKDVEVSIEVSAAANVDVLKEKIRGIKAIKSIDMAGEDG